jgi:hypothetical protein
MRGWFDGHAFQQLAADAYKNSFDDQGFVRAEFMGRIMKGPDTSDERISHVMVWKRDKELRSIAFRDSVDPEQWQWPPYFYDKTGAADIWELTGDLCAEKKRHDDALDCWERALRLLAKEQRPCEDLLALIVRARFRKRIIDHFRGIDERTIAGQEQCVDACECL